MSNTSMNHQLSLLFELQQIEVKIKKLQEKKSQIPPMLKEFEDKFGQEKLLLEEKQNQIEGYQVSQRSKSNLLLAQQDQLKKYQIQRFEVKTNKEYQSLEAEIAKLSEKNSSLEDQILESMFLIDKASEEYKGLEKTYQQKEGEYIKKREELLAEFESCEAEVKRWSGIRDIKHKLVEPSLIDKYESWKRRTGSFLLSLITEGNACSSCYITVPPQVINEIRKDVSVITCTSCGRILYFQETAKGQLPHESQMELEA